MKTRAQRTGVDCETQIEEAKTKIEEAEAQIEQARTRAELAETRTELAETRTELAMTRAEQAEMRAEQAETILQRVIQKEIEVCDVNAALPPKELGANGESPLERLTARQREILQHIAEGRNTKQTAEILNLSPKTVEYHRAKLMVAVNVHDIPGLVKLAVREGMVPVES